jgi:hypothetical protein
MSEPTAVVSAELLKLCDYKSYGSTKWFFSAEGDQTSPFWKVEVSRNRYTGTNCTILVRKEFSTYLLGIAAILRNELPCTRGPYNVEAGMLEMNFDRSVEMTEELRTEIEKALNAVRTNATVLKLLTKQAETIEFQERALESKKRDAAAELYWVRHEHDDEIRKLNADLAVCRREIKNFAAKLNENELPVEADEDDAPLPSLF